MACATLALVVSLGLIVAGLPATPTTSAATTTVSVDASRRFQRMDGFGVNANPKNWNFSDLTPALDLLANDLQAKLWRVDIYGTTTWIDDPSHLNASYYSVIYESPDFQTLWRTLSYLNAHGAQVVLTRVAWCRRGWALAARDRPGPGRQLRRDARPRWSTTVAESRASRSRCSTR